MRRILGTSFLVAGRVWRRLLMYVYRPLFASHGDNFRFDPFGAYTFETIYVGNHVNFGRRPTLMAGRSRIVIGDHVMFGPEVTIRGGCHRLDVPGRFLDNITNAEKRPEDDRGVAICDDVWVGARAIILHGVTIFRGAVVGAGAVVTRSVPPYAVVAGVPARVLRFRWDVDTILAHEERLYPPEKRICRQDLERWRDMTINRVGAGHGIR
jgi:acetyltransferase-like isoleucine patch superfamily enzyme